MTIFGFNTDVRHGETVYHVQSEARQAELLMQNMIFVKGQCIGKQVVSYANKAAEPGFSEDAIHELIKAQHKAVIGAISEGRIDSVLGTTQEIHDAGDSGLSLKWTKAEPNSAEASLTMHFQVSDAGENVTGAVVVSLAGTAAEPRILAEAVTDGDGNAEMRIPFDEELRREAAITVRATHNGKSATRRFKLRKDG
jgi:acyl-coenzyme A thioesterase PaaI-like protein